MTEDAESLASESPAVVGPTVSTRRLVVMIEHDGKEPSENVPARQAEATWAAVSAIWHPSLLARVDSLPVVEGVEYAAVTEPNDLRLVAEGAGARLDVDYRGVAASQGALILQGEIDRPAIGAADAGADRSRGRVGA